MMRSFSVSLKTFLLAVGCVALGSLLLAQPAAANNHGSHGGKEAVAIYGHGNSKCSDYNAFRFENNDTIVKNYQVWLNGMLSAYNTFVSSTGDVAQGRRSDDLMMWVQDFCELNPDTFFQRAAIELLRALESGQY